MREKIVFTFYSVISAAVWFVTLCTLLFAIYLMFTAQFRSPVLTVRDARVEPAATDDRILFEKGETPDDWYVLTMDLTVESAKLSPYEYSSNGFYLCTPTSVRGDFPQFVLPPAEKIVFSHIAPTETTAVVYVKSPDGPEALEKQMRNINVGLDDLTQRVGLFDIKLY